ncbi:hypothetical protein [Streptomyces sp. NPDC052107]|uniref:hypothetical protein n=1 Tax=Streptomyces sp. NPDC052107 TaxID=3155632 RepID=UPI00341DAB86
MVVGLAVAVAVVAVTVVLAVVLRGGKGEKAPRVSSSSAALQSAKRVALTPPDWGSGFVQDDPYENDDLNTYFLDSGCKNVQAPLASALAEVRRNVKTSDRTVYAYSSVTVYSSPAFAQADAARTRQDGQRCPKQTDTMSKTRWEGVHEVAVPTLKGLDDMAVEEGRQVADQTGKAMNNYYTYLTARQGQFLMQVFVTRADSQDGNLNDAINALSTMLRRL